ncbi:MoeA domain-containing protein domain I and II [Arthrobacter crystallopoietes BAB-32]|uniref:Molybdopterin molybdenumtransferase n=1 Tax=Arthrobacter crystallopoietes BAB-32 TaxID=1246476 RepID=N1V9A4_9MICC|nr:molybdopterin molybdotransferase MoeA [Arthrobacter crystallopoietes]EMY34828.1 MoeA domain-containing protein domain I and II [Arthrobacter crystallopoietes BAB-32]
MSLEPDSFAWTDARETAWSAGREALAAGTAGWTASSAPLEQCLGLVLAEPITAQLPVPHYASSAMDGWVLAGTEPWQLKPPGSALAASEAAPVVTGGLIPEGTVAVLRSEYGVVEQADGQQQLRRAPGVPAEEPPAGRHIRPAGEEAAAGDTVVPAGTRLTPAHVAVAAVCGYDSLPVYRAPAVGLLLTGDEVVTGGLPAPGQVRDTFGPTLPAIVAALGGQPSPPHRLPDDFEATREAIEGSKASVIVTTGGTGHSRADHLRSALQAAGARILVPSIRMRPGHPALLAQLPGGRLVIGLPGNPLAAMMALLTLGAPLLAGLTGRAMPELGGVAAGSRFAPLEGRHRLVPYALDGHGAVPAEHVGSAMMRGLAAASGVVVIPPQGARPGELVATLPLPW